MLISPLNVFLFSILLFAESVRGAADPLGWPPGPLHRHTDSAGEAKVQDAGQEKTKKHRLGTHNLLFSSSRPLFYFHIALLSRKYVSF